MYISDYFSKTCMINNNNNNNNSNSNNNSNNKINSTQTAVTNMTIKRMLENKII